MEEKKRVSFSSILGGQFLLNLGATRHWLFALYLFVLIILYITLNLKVADTDIQIRRNQTELKNLKADYTSKSAKLQYQSRQGEIERRLEVTGSKVERPQHPATLVKLP